MPDSNCGNDHDDYGDIDTDNGSNDIGDNDDDNSGDNSDDNNSDNDNDGKRPKILVKRIKFCCIS